MAKHESTPEPKSVGTLTPAQIVVALGEVATQLKALERISLMLQVEGPEDQRDFDALHTLLQGGLKTSGYLVELIGARCGGSGAMLLPNGADPMAWHMPPVFFPSTTAEKG